MSREIKFRGLDSLGNWVYGVPQTSTTLHLTLDCMAQYFTEQRRYGRQNVVFNPETLGQYSGLKDKTGVEVYYGDILKLNYPYNGSWIELKAVLTFNEDELRAELDIYGHPQYTSLWYDSLKMKDIERIGNIHQNPELLK